MKREANSVNNSLAPIDRLLSLAAGVPTSQILSSAQDLNTCLARFSLFRRSYNGDTMGASHIEGGWRDE
jgi:hypothetical protein